MRATNPFQLPTGPLAQPGGERPGYIPLSRNALIALAVVVLHVGLLVLLQSGLLMRASELLVPVEVLARLVEPPVVPPPAPVVEPPRPVAKAPPPPLPKQVTPRALASSEKPQPAPRAFAAPQPLAVAEPSAPAPAPSAPTALPAPPQPAPPSAAAPSAPAPPTVQLPSSDADYLQNPKPAYPETSRRLNEQGTSTIRVLIGADGQPQQAEIGKSSGFDRLDRAALATVMRWRYVPGKRNGVPEAMWFNVPIAWGFSNP
jgi:periplasmic protein TonB